MAIFDRHLVEASLVNFARKMDQVEYEHLANEEDLRVGLGHALLPVVKGLHFEIPLSARENWFPQLADKIRSVKSPGEGWRMDAAVFFDQPVKVLECSIELKHYSPLEDVLARELLSDMRRLETLLDNNIAKTCYLVVAYDNSRFGPRRIMLRAQRNRRVERVIVAAENSNVAAWRIGSSLRKPAKAPAVPLK